MAVLWTRRNIVLIPIYINYFLIALLVYSMYTYEYSLFSLGGSAILFAVSIIFSFLSIKVKELSIELSLGVLALTGIYALNFLSAWEISGKPINTPYLIISFICLYAFISMYLYIIRAPFKKYSDISEHKRTYFMKMIMTLILPVLVIGLVFAMFSALSVHLILTSDPNAATTCPLLKMSYVAMACIAISFLVTFVYASKLDRANMRECFLNEKIDVIKYSSRKIEKSAAILFLLVVFFGSILEIQRGLWPVWIETISIVGLMSKVIWKVYKNTVEGDSSIC